MVTYEQWRNDVFGQAPGVENVMVELREETYHLTDTDVLDYIDRALIDPDIHKLFTKEQIGIALNIIYSSDCSDFSFGYKEGVDESRSVQAIKNLRFLYVNYFERYCSAPLLRVGYDLDDDPIGYLCYMLWDIFVLYPGAASTAMTDAAIEVMRGALSSRNDNCLVSAIHGLGHWAHDVPDARKVLESWLDNPTTGNQAVIEYAKQAKSGCIQ